MSQQLRGTPGIQPAVAQNSPVQAEQGYQLEVKYQLANLQSVVAELRTNVLDLQTQLRISQRTAIIERLLNRFTSLHLFGRHDMNMRAEWESYFEQDATASYPFGQHRGREGMASWAFDSFWGEFKLRSLLTGNFTINVEQGGGFAMVTAHCVTGWGKEDEVNEHIAVNGFYRWLLVCVPMGNWQIQEATLVMPASDIVEKIKSIFKRRKDTKAAAAADPKAEAAATTTSEAAATPKPTETETEAATTTAETTAAAAGDAPKADTAAPVAADTPTESAAPDAAVAVETAAKDEAAKATAA
ncbi:hypothetical protein DV736_g2758, partial [Chaetothyriales sp. CBS 134916]